MFIPRVNAKNVSIEKVEVDSKSNENISENTSINGLSMIFNVDFFAQNDFVKYKIVMNNPTEKDYFFSKNISNSDYIEYIYEFDDNNEIIEKNKRTTMFFTIKYKKEVPIESLRNAGTFIEKNNISIELENTNNPKTRNIITILILLILLILLIVISKIIIKNKIIVPVLAILLLPIIVLAIEKLEIIFETNIKISPKPVCVRATELKTEKCEAFVQSGNYYCGSIENYGAMMSYGNLGEKGTLAVGDAFDCDVNNDGEYDKDTERFYYLSPEDGDNANNNIVLIYYNNTKAGLPDNKFASRYSNEIEGPNEAYLHLPTTEQWSNPLLFNNFERQIKTRGGHDFINDDGSKIYLPIFTYTNRSSRLVDVKEITYKCLDENSKIKEECSFLYENTNHSSKDNIQEYWTETYLNNNYFPYVIRGDTRKLSSEIMSQNTYVGVRPVIVISKNNILY